MNLQIVNSLSREQLDGLYIVLLQYSQRSLLPEILDIFGQEATLKFLDIFAGCTIKVPSADELRTAIRDFDIYQRLKGAEHPQEVIQQLQREYSIDERTIRRVHKQLEELVQARRTLIKLARAERDDSEGGSQSSK